MTPALWPVWGLVFARAAGLLALAPPTGWRHFPPSLRLAVAAVLTGPLALAIAPAGAPLALTMPEYVAAVAREAAVGLLMGLGLWLLVWGAFAAGHLQDVVGGFAAADEEDGPLAGLFTVLVLVFFVQLNGLHWLVAFFRQSYVLLPPGQAADLTAAASWVYWPSLFFTGLLQLAGPVVLGTVLAALMVSSLQRVLPELRAAEVLPAARALVTLLALGVVAPLLGAVLLHQVSVVADVTARWLATLG